MKASSPYDALLDPGERVEGRPFTDPVCTRTDAAVMSMMLVRQRGHAGSWGSDRAGSSTLRQTIDDGRREWLAVPDMAALLGAQDITAIGFFGQARDVDHSVLFALEEEVVDSFPAYTDAGLLSYYDLQLAEGAYGFGNLILFSTPDVPPEWHANLPHQRAVEISPEYYRSVRLHKGSIPGPFLGRGELRIERTKYLDFGSEPAWRGLRVFA